jgi:hypothetical protein
MTAVMCCLRWMWIGRCLARASATSRLTRWSELEPALRIHEEPHGLFAHVGP